MDDLCLKYSERNGQYMKNVLVIGGSAFTGRVFSIMASRNGGFELHVVNRGNHPLNLERVAQYKCDRHDAGALPDLVPDVTYDALVDFCAYSPGEISPVVEALGDRVKQYIFFSTASIYAPGDSFLGEGAPLLDAPGKEKGMVVEYVQGKIALENELIAACAGKGLHYTILRPTFIYGPFNYAPRESYFIEKIAKKEAVPVPTDATSRFNFIYVLDIADALMLCIGDEKAYDAAFNLAAPEAITYPGLLSCLETNNGGPFPTREVTIAQVEKESIPLPFPLTGDTLINGEKFAAAFGLNYTPFATGMEKTFNIFYTLYTES